MVIFRAVADWLDDRTAYRSGVRVLLDEPILAGVNWWFTLGSVLLFLIVLQAVTGAVLTMYYAPTPTLAYDSVRFITSQLLMGRTLRALHVFGASFIVVFAGLHLLRVLIFGAYKKPREVTWWTGIALLLVLLGFALTGYLLPWDQRAYWATVVTINIARSTPVAGPFIASVMRGGAEIGALTLSRWYAAHVILLPAAVVLLVVSHLYLMRRHGIAGHFKPVVGAPRPFYPFHAFKDAVVVAGVFALLFGLALTVRPGLDAVADPTDATYVPRPEWYFLPLFQLLKYFPGRLEPLAAHGVPGLVVLLLALLPFLDRGPARHPMARRLVSAATAVVVTGALVLLGLGLRDAPPPPAPVWGARAVAGRAIAGRESCARCHAPGGPGPDLARGRTARDDQWIDGHLADPEMIAPGLRPSPPGGLNVNERKAVVAYARAERSGIAESPLPEEQRAALVIVGVQCIRCHRLDGDGARDAPDLTHVGAKAGRDQAWLEKWITDPTTIKPDTDMPAFGPRLSEQELRAVAKYLAGRR